jgi:hypothetical protein
VRAHAAAAYEIEERAAGRLVESAVDKVGAQLAKALLLGYGVAANSELAGDDEGDE